MYDLEYSTACMLDSQDKLSSVRNMFNIPKHKGTGKEKIYLCGNSLGLAPKRAKDILMKEFDGWKNLVVDGHFHEEHNWYDYHLKFKKGISRLLNCDESEVTVMNSLTVNLQFMLSSFYPYSGEGKILVLESAFPSDRYAVQTFLQNRNKDPEKDLIYLKPYNTGLYGLEMFESVLNDNPDISLVLIEGVNYLTGQVIQISEIGKLTRKRNIILGVDLAHAIGNIPLDFSDGCVDFAVWCSYKYLNAGPGAIGGCYVNCKYHTDSSMSKLSGWWGLNSKTRFSRIQESDFEASSTVDSWQISNPSIFGAAPLVAALEIFNMVRLEDLYKKSNDLYDYLYYLISNKIFSNSISLITQAEFGTHGSQLSIKCNENIINIVSKEMLSEDSLFIFDIRKPDIIRVSPVPLYNTFSDVWFFVDRLSKVIKNAEESFK